MDDLKPHGTNGRSKLQTFHDEVSPSVAALQENTNGLLRLKADEGCIPSLRRSGISAPRSTNLIKFLYIPLCRRKISTSAGSPPTTKPAWASRHRSCYFPFAFSGGQSGETPKVLGRKQQKCAESGGGGGGRYNTPPFDKEPRLHSSQSAECRSSTASVTIVHCPLMVRTKANKSPTNHSWIVTESCKLHLEHHAGIGPGSPPPEALLRRGCESWDLCGQYLIVCDSILWYIKYFSRL